MRKAGMVAFVADASWWPHGRWRRPDRPSLRAAREGRRTRLGAHSMAASAARARTGASP